MILTTIITFGVYLAILVNLIRYGFISRYQVIPFTDAAMSQTAYVLIVLFSCVIGYIFAQKWWKIIYIDGVYYFDPTKKPHVRKRVMR
jgi:hypothetical protein